ncbi:hypothetical protein Ancab_003246 [Ancistrocladus abbreviatus]
MYSLSLHGMPSASSLFSAYASLSATIKLFQSAAEEFIPEPIRHCLYSYFSRLFRPRSNDDKLTLIIEEGNIIGQNLVYEASEAYLRTKISPSAHRLRVSQAPKENHLTVSFEKGEEIVDCFEGIELKWTFFCNKDDSGSEWSYFELNFDRKFKEKVLSCYLPGIMKKSKDIKEGHKVLKLFTLGDRYTGGNIYWEAINLEHPSTFETLAMDQELKKSIIDDLERFKERREFYKRVGKAWKRGYLLYGPPGTGKSSLIAAIANYLKFDIYDLQLGSVMRDSDLRRVLLATGNRSVLVIEDIDCSVIEDSEGVKASAAQLSFAGLLNFIDGLWSSCGDERIIIFTTNHKEKLDPALLRPGRMDMHIHMSYLTNQGFRVLASNYLGITGHHRLFREIERLIETTSVTPAQVAEELMRTDNADVALDGVIALLKRKRMEDEEAKADGENGFAESLEKRCRKLDASSNNC